MGLNDSGVDDQYILFMTGYVTEMETGLVNSVYLPPSVSVLFCLPGEEYSAVVYFSREIECKIGAFFPYQLRQFVKRM